MVRSSKLDECFDDPEEREFLGEVIESALHEARDTLYAHEQDVSMAHTAGELMEEMENSDRQKRKTKFFEQLFEYLSP